MKNLRSLKHIEFSYDDQMPNELGQLFWLERLPLFAVHRGNEGSSIKELKELKELRGKLTINLEQVRGREEAQEANLQGKQNITALKFVWNSTGGQGCSHDEQVLEGLQPHPNIESIKIENYMGDKFPLSLWMRGVTSSSDTAVDNLVELKLKGCNNCQQILNLGILPRLKYLHISGMEKVRCLGNEFYGIDSGGCRRQLFPALKHLSLRNMNNLDEWREPALEEVSDIVVFPCLEELSVAFCHGLRKVPASALAPLIQLRIEDCARLSFSSEECKCTSLACVEITECPAFLSCFLENILGCLTQLKRLKVGDCSNKVTDFFFLNFSIRNLTSLEELEILSSSLPDQLQHLISLKSLTIWCFREEALPEWLGKLSSLQSFSLHWCLALRSLPTPMKRLSKLTTLWIDNCYSLQERCVRGREWDNISHIPDIKFTCSEPEYNPIPLSFSDEMYTTSYREDIKTFHSLTDNFTCYEPEHNPIPLPFSEMYTSYREEIKTLHSLTDWASYL